MSTQSRPTADDRPRYWGRFVLPMAWMVAIYFGSNENELPGPEGIPGFDKVAHFGAFGLLATLWARALVQPGRSRFTALVALAIASAYGATDEYHQSLVPGRSVEVADWVADTLGAALAATLYCYWRPYRQLLDRRIVRPARGRAVAVSAPAVGEPNS